MKKVAAFLAVLLSTFFEEVMKNNTKKLAEKLQDEWTRIKPNLIRATPILSVIFIVIGFPLVFGSSPPFPNFTEDSDEEGVSCEENCMNKCDSQNECLEECSSLTVNTVTETTATTTIITTITTVVITTETHIVTTTIITTITITTTSTQSPQCSTTQYTTTEKR